MSIYFLNCMQFHLCPTTIRVPKLETNKTWKWWLILFVYMPSLPESFHVFFSYFVFPRFIYLSCDLSVCNSDRLPRKELPEDPAKVMFSLPVSP